MKFIQTLSIDDDPYKNSFGWCSVRYHLISWALSILQLDKLYGGVELYVNSEAAYLLEELKLPFSKLNVTHDCLKWPNEKLWALPKIYTYSLQKDPFLHIDGDVFIFQSFEKEILESNLVAQNIEEATAYYTSTQKEIITHFQYIPKVVKDDFYKQKPIKAINAGIIGGTDICFFERYTKEAFKYIRRNVNQLPFINVDRFNVFFEQHLYYAMAEKEAKNITLLLPNLIGDNQYQNLGDFHEVPCNRSYLHLLGHYKRDEFTCRQMAAKLRELYPGYYYLIMKLCEDKGIAYPLKNFYSKHFLEAPNQEKIHRVAREKYLKKKLKKSERVLSQSPNTPLNILAYYINTFWENKSGIDVNDFKSDFENFKSEVTAHLNYIACDDVYLYGRDLESQNWYCQIFGRENNLNKKFIVKEKHIAVVESSYDWAGILNKLQRVGVKYYEQLKIRQGRFYNLIVPEVSECLVSLIDLDEIQALILRILECPHTIGSLLKKMEQYIDEDVVHNHYDEFEELTTNYLKELVANKAVSPVLKM